MAKYCLPPHLADEFKKRLKTGGAEFFENLHNIGSGKRRTFFTEFLGGDNAKNVNALFERKSIQKDVIGGYINWAKQVTGISEPVRNDLLSKINRMRKEKIDILNPDVEERFLQDLAGTRLGVDVNFVEAKKITKIADNIDELKVKWQETITREAPLGNFDKRVEYGNSIIDMYDYVSSIKPEKTATEKILSGAGVPRAIMSSFDLSAPGRQGWGMVTKKEFWQNLWPMVKAFFDKTSYRDIQADIITRPNYEMAKKAGLRLSNLGDKLSEKEEEFMTDLLDNIPGIAGSQRAYTTFLSKLRMDVYDNYVKSAVLAGENIKVGSQVSKDLADVVNNFTGSGSWRKLDPAIPVFNQLFFSPRKLIAVMQIFNPERYLNPKISPTARKEALKNLIGTTSVSFGILGMAQMAGAEVEIDPLSSDFGKIKIGDTRIDVTGGNASYVTFLKRMITGQTKSTSSGQINSLTETGFGKNTRGDVLIRFMRTKLSPNSSLFVDYLFGENVVGKKFEWEPSEEGRGEIIDRLIPLGIQDVIDVIMEDEGEEALVLSVFGNLFGFSTSSYAPKNKKSELVEERIRQSLKEKKETSKKETAEDRIRKRLEAKR